MSATATDDDHDTNSIMDDFDYNSNDGCNLNMDMEATKMIEMALIVDERINITINKNINQLVSGYLANRNLNMDIRFIIPTEIIKLCVIFVINCSPFDIGPDAVSPWSSQGQRIHVLSKLFCSIYDKQNITNSVISTLMSAILPGINYRNL
eukprot:139452_1